MTEMTPEIFDLLPNVEKMRLIHLPHYKEWYPATRSGPTGQGHTAECYILDKREDNKSGADVHGVEVKTSSSRAASARIRTATRKFTDSLGNPIGNTILNTFGTRKSDRMMFDASITTQKSTRRKKWVDQSGVAHEPSLVLEDKNLTLYAGSLTAYMGRKEIEDEILDPKLETMCVTKTAKRVALSNASSLDYNFNSFYVFDGLIKQAFWDQFEGGAIGVEFRMRGHDHGCSLNMNLNRLNRIYEQAFFWDGPTDTIHVLKSDEASFNMLVACSGAEVVRASEAMMKRFVR
jgi:hypothetical protein